jgi:hypothetical protein
MKQNNRPRAICFCFVLDLLYPKQIARTRYSKIAVIYFTIPYSLFYILRRLILEEVPCMLHFI